jgi:threonine synthase
MIDKYHFRCINCGAEYPADKPQYLCPVCSSENMPGKPPKGILKTTFNYDAIRSSFGKNIFRELEKEHFLNLLPIKDLSNLPKLKIGDTPLYHYDEFGGKKTGFDLFLKDDSQNPTFSFKDRASAIVSAWAKEHDIDTIIAASTGNAGSSLAGICSAQGQKSVIFVPAAAPVAKLTQIMMYGAQIVPVAGTYDDAFSLSVKATEAFSFYNRNTAFNPLTIEGKKTVSFEIFSQLEDRIPDRIFVPVGDGVILSGVYKGFEDLLQLGIINKIPVIVAVQAEGSKNLINNLHTDDFRVITSSTIADSISVDVPANFFMSADYLWQYVGETLTVSDEEILDASLKLARSTGIFAEPAASAAFAGMLKYQAAEILEPNSKNVVLLTGSGLKDLKPVQTRIQIPEPVSPDVESLFKIFPAKSK